MKPWRWTKRRRQLLVDILMAKALTERFGPHSEFTKRLPEAIRKIFVK